MGRPSTYTPELANYVCKVIATHKHGLNKLNKMYDDFPDATTIYAWMYDHEEFSQQYLNARRLQANVLADSALEIVHEIPRFIDKDGVERIDSGILGQAKLGFETLKWHASKMAPKVWGDKQQLEQAMEENVLIKAELATLRAQLAEKNKRDY